MFLQTHPCVDCDENDIDVLEFDHLFDKKNNIGRIEKFRTIKALQDEIAKCEVVCANCHRRRTRKRGEHTRIECLERVRENVVRAEEDLASFRIGTK